MRNGNFCLHYGCEATFTVVSVTRVLLCTYEIHQCTDTSVYSPTQTLALHVRLVLQEEEDLSFSHAISSPDTLLQVLSFFPVAAMVKLGCQR